MKRGIRWWGDDEREIKKEKERRRDRDREQYR